MRRPRHYPGSASQLHEICLKNGRNRRPGQPNPADHKISWNNIGPQGPAGVVNGFIDNSSGASLITAKVGALLGTFNNGNDVVSCNLVDGTGNQLDSAGVTLIPGLDNSAGSDITMLGATAPTASGNVRVLCENGTGSGGAAALSVVITAVPVAKITHSFG